MIIFTQAVCHLSTHSIRLGPYLAVLSNSGISYFVCPCVMLGTSDDNENEKKKHIIHHLNVI